MKPCEQDISKIIWARALKLCQLIGDDELSLIIFEKKEKRKKKVVRVMPLSNLAFYIEKHIVGDIVYIKHISSLSYLWSA